MAEYLDVTGDEIWMGSALVGRILMPIGTQRDWAEALIQAAQDREELEEVEAERDAAKSEADELRAVVAGLEDGDHAGQILKLHDALKIALADNDKWREAYRNATAAKPKTRKRK